MILANWNPITTTHIPLLLHINALYFYKGMYNINNVDKTTFFNPSVTSRVKISQNVDILAKVYLVHLMQRHNLWT